MKLFLLCSPELPPSQLNGHLSIEHHPQQYHPYHLVLFRILKLHNFAWHFRHRFGCFPNPLIKWALAKIICAKKILFYLTSTSTPVNTQLTSICTDFNKDCCPLRKRFWDDFKSFKGSLRSLLFTWKWKEANRTKLDPKSIYKKKRWPKIPVLLCS